MRKFWASREEIKKEGFPGTTVELQMLSRGSSWVKKSTNRARRTLMSCDQCWLKDNEKKKQCLMSSEQ
jgi:hypothetical protein